jgi:hypothetical protein
MSDFNLRCAVALIVVLSAPHPSAAQILVFSRLSGTVRDQSGLPVVGVTVAARSPSLIGGARVVVTDQEGRYRLSALDPGEYEVRMFHDGFATAVYSRIHLTPGASVDVDGMLDVASVSERVDVNAPSVDVRTSASTQELDRPLLEHLPTSRDIYALINLTPGVSQGSGFGGTQGANALWVDGVDATETTTQTAWTSFSYNWVEGVQVLAPGAPAEYGQFTGVGGSYALRSGSNRVSGLFEVLHPPSSWVAHNTPGDSPSGRSEAWDTSAQLGGPLREDRAWFFFGYHYSHIESRPPFYTGPGSTIFAHPAGLLKLTASPGRTVRVDGFVEHGHSVLSADGLGINPLDGTQDINQPQTSWNLRATWTPGSRDTVDFRIGGYRSPQTFDPHPPATRSGPYPHYDEITGIESRNIQDYTEEGRRQQSLAVAWTRYMKAVGIGHELKLGFEYEHARLRSTDHIPGDRMYIDDDGQPAYVQLWRGEVRRASANRTSIFVQDAWQVSSSVTINAGARLDVNRGSVPVHGALLSNDPIAPRVGVAWDVTSSHRTVVRAHYGRYYEANIVQYVLSSDQSQATPQSVGAIVGPGPDDFEIVEVDDTRAYRSVVQPGLKQAYVDQYTLGAERQVVGGLTAKVQFVRRNFDRVFGLIRVGETWSPIETVDPGPDGEIGTQDDGGALTVYRRTSPGVQLFVNPDGASRHYNGLQFIARKPLANRWEMQASYTWSQTRGNMSNVAQTNWGHPGITGYYSDPNRLINANGKVPLDFTNSVKLLGTYALPWLGGLNLSGIYQFDSGHTWERTFFVRGVQGPVRAEPRGTRRLPAATGLDVRADKTLRLPGRGGTVGVFVDVFNVTNRGVLTAVNRVSGSGFGMPLGWSSPRTARIGARWMF